MLKLFSKISMVLLLAGMIQNVIAAVQPTPAAPIQPQDFAYAVPLRFEGQDALYQTALPFSVYQNTVRSDLGDLRVFNAQGEVVPHMLQQPEHSSISQPILNKLVFFPLHGSADTGLEQLSIQVKRNTSGTLIDINSHAKPSAQSRVSGYLLDTSALKQSIQAFELDWKGSKDNFVGALNIDSSDDLKHWVNVVRGAPIASMQFGDRSLLQRRVEVAALKAKYIRLSWPPEQAPLQLTSLNAELATTSIDAPLSWQSAAGSSATGIAGEYQFDMGAHLPLQRIRIELPQNNTLVQAAIFSRTGEADTWRLESNSLLYKLHHSGQALINPDIKVASNHRYWLLRVEQKNGGLGSGIPVMKAGWQPHQLQFVTRGTAPFQLAYGSSVIKPAEFQMQNILASAGQDAPGLKIQPAQTGTQITKGGEARLDPAPQTLPWKKWSLWVVLGVAVLLLGWMAFRLLKQLESHDKGYE